MESWCILYYVLACMNAVQSLQLEASPNSIEPGKTESLVLNCSFAVSDLFKMKLLYTLSLSFSYDDTSGPEVLATTSLNVDQVYTQNKDGVASGAVRHESESYLQYHLNFPYYHVTGNYKCQAHGIGFDWRPLTLTAQVNISGKELSLKSLSEELRLLRLENIHLATALKSYSANLSETDRIQDDLINVNLSTAEPLDGLRVNLCEITYQLDCLNRTRKDRHATLVFNFYESKLFEGRRYYIKRTLERFTLSSAQSTCDWYGGYLAEIDNDLEMDFIRNFVKNYTFKYVWISGSDEGEEGHWVNTRTNTTMKYFKWGYDVAESRIFNCIVIDKTYDWYMNAAVCSTTKPDGSYVCEIPD